VTDQFTVDAGAYVLGALTPEDRQAFETHLASCAHCAAEVREFAELPGLLSRLPADNVLAALAGEEPPAPPPSLLPALQFAARRERRTRRWRAVAAGLVAASVVGLGAAVLVDQRSTPSPSPAPAAQALPFRRVAHVPVSATASLVAEPWGTQIEMRCTYQGRPWPDGRPRRYSLVAKDKAGRSQTLGDWMVLIGTEVKVTTATATPRDQLDELRVLSTSGSVLLVLDL
jgi:anti-sigma factor RsiW